MYRVKSKCVSLTAMVCAAGLAAAFTAAAAGLEGSITTPGAGLQEETQNDPMSDTIPFIYSEGDEVEIYEGVYYLMAEADNSYVMNITGNSADPGANVDIMPNSELDCQKFLIQKQQNGFYTITSVLSGLVLEVSGGSPSPEANLQQGVYTGAAGQHWKFLYAGENRYYICSDLGTYIDNYGGMLQDANNVWMYSENHSSSQMWMLSEAQNMDSPDISAEEEPSEISNAQIDLSMLTSVMFVSSIDQTKVLNVQDASTENGANIELMKNHNMDQQIFYLDKTADGFYSIRSAQSGLVLTVDQNNPAQEANLIQMADSGLDGQKWRILQDVDGMYKIQSSLGTYIDCYGGLTDDSTNIWMYGENNSYSQKWIIQPVTRYSDLNVGDEVRLVDGIYTIAIALDYQAVMQVEGGAYEDGANIVIGSDRKEEHQKFRLIFGEDGYYTIIAMHSGKSIEVADENPNPETNLRQNTISYQDCQRWKLIYAGDNHCYIMSKMGCLIDLAGGNTEEGSNIWLYSQNGSHSQMWDFFMD